MSRRSTVDADARGACCAVARSCACGGRVDLRSARSLVDDSKRLLSRLTSGRALGSRRLPRAMSDKSLALVAAAAARAAASVGCSRNNIEAVNLANEGDQAKSANLDEAISKYEQATQARSGQRAHLVEARARVREEGRLAEDGDRVLPRGGGRREGGREEGARRLLLPPGLRARAARGEGAAAGPTRRRRSRRPSSIDPNYGEAYGELGIGPHPPRRRGGRDPELDEGARDQARQDAVLRHASPTSTAA